MRLAGDSGDGMQLAGTQLTNTSALVGQRRGHVPRLPGRDPRPEGTRAGVSGFQMQFASEDIFTPGDQVDALVVMNPAALVTNLGDLVPGGILIVNEDSFRRKDLKLAGCADQPAGGRQPGRLPRDQGADDEADAHGRRGAGPGPEEADRCRNFFAMGLVFWLYDRALEPTLRFIEREVRQQAGRGRGQQQAPAGRLELRRDDRGVRDHATRSSRRSCRPGMYRNITGNQALAWGLMAAAKLSGKELFYGSYPDHAGQRHPARAGQAQELRRPHVSGRGRNCRDRAPPSGPPSAGPWP